MPELRTRLASAVAPRYTVDRELASGGMGMVFVGRDPVLDRDVAIKVLPPERATAVAVERFLREARLLAQLAHPHIVPVFEAQQGDGLFWFVMPLMRGETLAHRIASGPLAAGEVRRIGLDLLDALEHAHAQGVVHRDLKPSNIFLDGGHALLADFGVALLETADADTLTGTDQLVGTLRYMAPEQRSGSDATPRSDIYSLGVTLFEAATGKRWEASDASASRAWRAMPPSLGRALRGALHADPDRRWPDAAAFRRALAGGHRWTVRRSAIAGLAVVVLLLAGMAIRDRLATSPTSSRRAALVVLSFSGSDSTAKVLARYTSQWIEFSAIRVLPGARVGKMTMDSGLRVAERVVTGRVTVTNDTSAIVDAQVYDSTGAALDLLRVPGNPHDPASWGRAVAEAIVARLFPTELTEFQQLSRTEPNRRALDAYREGQRLFQSGRWQESEAKFAEAEQADSGLLRARWQELIARQWQSLPFKNELAQLSARTGQMQEPFPRLLRAQMELDLVHRLALFDSLVREYPNYSMVREMAANELFSRGPLVGRPLRDGIEAFRRAAQEIPDLDQANTYTQTIWGAVRLGDERLAREQLALRHAPKNDEWTSILWLAVNGRFRRWLAVPARELILVTADSSYRTTLSRAVRMGLDVDDPWDQEAIGRYLERHATSDSARANALAAQATALLLTGQPLEALRRLDRGASAAPHNRDYQLQRGEWRLLLPLLPGAPIALPETTRDSGRQLLRAVAASDSLWPRAAWALAVDAIARHANGERDSLLALLRARSGVTWIADLTAFADAIRLATDSHLDSALVLSQRIHRMPDDAETGLRGPLVRALVYLYRGTWRSEQGDAAGAEAEWLWHENNDIAGKPQGAPEQGEIDAALSGVARLLRATNLSMIDRQAEGCALLDRVNALWHNAEAPMQRLQVRVAEARTKCR
jgi:hypothetical protein